MNKQLVTGVQVALGFLLGIVLNAVSIWLLFLLPSLLPANLFSRGLPVLAVYTLMFIGVIQLIWQLPVIWLLRRMGHKAPALGVILAASVTALINATCWGLIEARRIRIGG